MTRTIPLKESLRVVVPAEWNSDKKGDFLEQIAAHVLRRQSYEISSRVRFTGMEVDLLGRHKPSDDRVYIECKFHHTNISANVLDIMVGQAYRKDISRLALFSSSPLTKEAQGAYEDLKQKKEISFSYYGPDKLLEALVDAQLAPRLPASLSPAISHATLLVHPENDYVWLLQEQSDGKPAKIIAYGLPASSQHNTNTIRALLDKHEMLSGLPVSMYEGRNETHPAAEDRRPGPPSEVVSPVTTADNLIDYRPCKPSDFVGRVALQREIFHFLDLVRDGHTDTRLLAFVGASGCGKSSLVAKLAERFRNKKWRHRYFLYPVDVRSARGPLFVSQALLAGVRAASASDFLHAPRGAQVEDVDDVLSGASLAPVLRRLKEEGRVLVLFFDQFEEAFTKSELFPVFKAFRRIALDVNARKENLVLGFSWRTGISLSDDNPAYQMWNELRDHRLTKTLGNFDSAESSRMISQFEHLLGQKLLAPLRRQLHEQGQGLPWFLKKLCIHIYEQVKSGASQVDLVGSRLNVKRLFDGDLDPLTEAQISCLRHIASHSPVDSLEIYERYGTEVVNALIDRRLIVRAGERFAVYWDIFRDYLVEGTVPHIPWTYIPNSTLRMALATCEVLASRGVRTTTEIAHELGYSNNTVINIITDLQNLVICGKSDDGKHKLVLGEAGETIPERMHSQFSDHIVYQRLLEVAGESGTLPAPQGVRVVRELYSSANVKPKTRDRYLSRLLPWLSYAGLIEQSGNTITVVQRKSRGVGFGQPPAGGRHRALGQPEFLAAATPEATLETLQRLMNKGTLSRQEIATQGWRNEASDLVALGLASWRDGSLVQAAKLLNQQRSAEEALVSELRATRTMLLLERQIADDANLSRADIGLRIAIALGREWKRSSAVRYANGLFRYLEFLTSSG